jgi:nicotinamidase-related amidase
MRRYPTHRHDVASGDGDPAPAATCPPPAPLVLRRGDATLVVIDVQEAFRKAVDRFEQTAREVGRLVRGARILGVPIIVTEQYPKGLGATVPEVGLDGERALAKTVFAATRADGFDLGGRSQALLCGIEAHVCVHQTVQALLAEGVEVHVCADAVSSRTPENRAIGIERAREAGALITSVETALLELCGEAGTPEFKAVQQVIM